VCITYLHAVSGSNADLCIQNAAGGVDWFGCDWFAAWSLCRLVLGTALTPAASAAAEHAQPLLLVSVTQGLRLVLLFGGRATCLEAL
jgi:hypothetical protein